MKLRDIANETQQTTEPEWSSAVLKHIADELRHVRSMLAVVSRRKKPDVVLVRVLTRRRNELLRRMQLLAHEATFARAFSDDLQSYH